MAPMFGRRQVAFSSSPINRLCVLANCAMAQSRARTSMREASMHSVPFFENLVRAGFMGSLLALAAVGLVGCGSGGGGDGGGGSATPPTPSTTKMETGIVPDATGLHLVKNTGSTTYRLVGQIYVVRSDGSSAASPQPPERLSLRVTNVRTGAVAFTLPMNSRTFTVVQPVGSTRPGWLYSAPANFIAYTLGDELRLEAIDDPASAIDNLTDGGLIWEDTETSVSDTKVPPVFVGSVQLLAGSG